MADQNDNSKKGIKIQDAFTLNHHMGITRERSFVRTPNHQQQNQNKRRSGTFNQMLTQQQMRGKPAIEIYRPPNVRIDGKLNVHAQEFTMNRSHELQNSRSALTIFSPDGNLLQHSKSSGNIALTNHHPLQNRINGQQQQQQQQHQQQLTQQQQQILNHHSRPVLMSHPLQMSVSMQSSHMPLVNSPSSGNILQSAPRVKFAPDTMMHQANQYKNNNNNHTNGINMINNNIPLQRSKSLSSADTLTKGISCLGLGSAGESADIGQFPPEIQAVISKAVDDPNQLTARCLMELATHIMNRAIEGRRYALPISKLCISIIAKEKKETFLEALLNTCRQWYQERDKVLCAHSNPKNPLRPRFTAFMAFLTEMFCQLKRRQLQLRTQCDGVPPPIVLLTLLSKCCEDCVRAPVRSLSEIECLFFVLTCIGRDLETHLPRQLDALLGGVRDAFLNSNASAPGIRRTLLQLIELQASRWQLPGNTVLYYYPSSK